MEGGAAFVSRTSSSSVLNLTFALQRLFPAESEKPCLCNSRLQSFETEVLGQERDLAGLTVINRELIAKAESLGSPQRVVLDVDSTEIPVYGQQENSAYNGHFDHPLLLFNREGDCLATKLRPGNVHSADGWEEMLLPEIERRRGLARRWCCARTPLSPSRKSAKRWRRVERSTPSASRPTTAWSGTLLSCWQGQWAGRATSRWFGTRASSIRRRVGRPRGGRESPGPRHTGSYAIGAMPQSSTISTSTRPCERRRLA